VAPAHGNGPLAARQLQVLLMRHLLERRLLFFGGKGGVGKTTCASAVALAASRAGKRTLLVSTDPAHSTSDIFERPFSRDERDVLPGLTGLEVDAELEARRYLDEVRERIAGMFSPSVVREAMRQIDMAASMPGLADVALFDRICDIIVTRRQTYDVTIFDTAPTGHTLRLLHMPEAMSAWVQALVERRRQAVEASGAVRGAVDGDLQQDPIVEALERRQRRLVDVHDEITRYESTAFVLVLIPERLPIEESARAVADLESAHLHVGAAIINRVLPEDLPGTYYQARKEQERHYLDEIERRFRAVQRVRVPLLESDVHGIPALERVAEHLLGTAGW
jgi:arsenite-transporting ATPase